MREKIEIKRIKVLVKCLQILNVKISSLLLRITLLVYNIWAAKRRSSVKDRKTFDLWWGTSEFSLRKRAFIWFLLFLSMNFLSTLDELGLFSMSILQPTDFCISTSTAENTHSMKRERFSYNSVSSFESVMSFRKAR